VEVVRVIGDRIWVGTEAGLATAKKDDPNLLDYSRWTAFTTENWVDLKNDHVLCITPAEANIVVGTEKGVFEFDPSDSTWYSLGLESRRINDLVYQDQKLYAATDAGLYEYDNQTWTAFPNSGLLSGYFNSLQIDPSGTFWVGTDGKGIASFSASQWQAHLIDGPPANTFVGMETDPQGNLWCAQERYGASVFDGFTWTSLNSVPEIDGHWIKAVKRDLGGNLWFSSWGGGVMKLDPDSNWTARLKGWPPTRLMWWSTT
jgi:ligand-binding sensor domain-containing protein